MAFKILRKNCCGLDIHKTWIFACIGITDSNGRTEYKQARFSSFSNGLRDLADWLAKYSCSDVCMESTGKYWIPVFNILEKTCWVTLAHPKYTKPQKGNKTDRKDAKWICDLYMCGMVKPSFIPPPDIRQLRDLMRYRMKLTNTLTGEKNRAQNCLTVSNLKLDDVFSDVFGKSSRSIIQYILDHPGEQFDASPFIHRRCKHPVEEIQAAVDGAVSREQAAHRPTECAQGAYRNGNPPACRALSLPVGIDPHGSWLCRRSADGCGPYLRDWRGYVGISLCKAPGFLGRMLSSK